MGEYAITKEYDTSTGQPIQSVFWRCQAFQMGHDELFLGQRKATKKKGIFG